MRAGGGARRGGNVNRIFTPCASELFSSVCEVARNKHNNPRLDFFQSGGNITCEGISFGDDRFP